jgi:hypothetical protein
MTILTQFLFRLSFGLALAMAWTPAQMVGSGFFRVHLYVLLGMNVLATLVALTQPHLSVWLPIVAAAASYLGSVAWLYERPKLGTGALYVVASTTFAAALLTGWSSADEPEGAWVFQVADLTTSGLLLGVTLAAMLLGHWYLNSPGTDRAPLRRLVLLLMIVLLVRMLLCAVGNFLGLRETGTSFFVVLRWLTGLVGAMVLAVMAWATLRIPNTQSATGILYVAVVATFLGELISLLLSPSAFDPV